MRLLKFLLRYFPPGIALEYIQSGEVKTKMIDLLDLDAKTDIKALALRIKNNEPIITDSVMEQLEETLLKLQSKVCDDSVKHYYKYKTLKTHLLPLTNIAFDKLGKRCLTGSYDRTCKVWDIDSGKELLTLEGHKNVVYAVSFNNPTSDKILTGSFDKTAILWCSRTGHCFHKFWGHDAEVVAVKFSPSQLRIATGSMDTTSKIFQIDTGQEVGTLKGHFGEIISLHYNNDGNQIITGSFDNTINVWDTRNFKKIASLAGHDGKISNCLYSFDCRLIASSSLDKTAKVWDVRMYACLGTLASHEDEVLDLALNYPASRLATASCDATARLWDITGDFREILVLEGHREEVSKAPSVDQLLEIILSLGGKEAFCLMYRHIDCPNGNSILTCSLDKTARLWSAETGRCIQSLAGHTDDVFSCAFSYNGDTIVTASKDNTCTIWR